MQVSAKPGVLYLIPNFLGPVDAGKVFPDFNRQVLENLRYFIAEREKSARKLIKTLLPEKNQSELFFFELNKHTSPDEINGFIDPLLQGESMGLMSEAGLPAIADPGAQIVRLAHRNNIRVVPLVGPSSIFLALMASGLDGQRFAFRGYLPVDKGALNRRLRELESYSRRENETQIFIETPYRNNKLFKAFLQKLHPATLLCVATNLTLPDQTIWTHRIAEWQQLPAPDLHKKPTVFLFLAG